MTDIKRNAAHYYDPTAYKAIMSIEKERKKEREKKMINKELHKGDIIIVETNGKRIYGVIVTNNNLNYNQDQVGMVNISTQTESVGLAYVDVFTNQPATAICNKVWNVWKADIVEFMRECTTEEMYAIDKALRYTFGLYEPQKKADITDMAASLQKGAHEALNEVLKAEVEELKAYIEKLEKTNINLQAENDSVKSENKNLQSQLEKAREDTDQWIEQAAKAEEAAPDVVALTAERDTYKAMYEKLLDKLIGA